MASHPSSLSMRIPSGSLEQRLALVELENANLRAQNDQQLVEVTNLQSDRARLLALASSSMRVLRLQQQAPRSEGIWTTDGDSKLLEEVLAGSEKEEEGRAPEGDRWKWLDIPRFGHPLTRSRFIRGDVRPFPRSFPLELFLMIVACTDLPTLCRLGRVSFACLSIVVPKIYREVHLGPGRPYFAILFVSRTNLTSPRLIPLLSLANLRILSISSLQLPSSSSSSLSSHSLDTARLALDRLIITIEVRPDELDPYDDFDEEEAAFIRLIRISEDFLSLVNPTELVIKVSRCIITEGGPSYCLAQDAAREMTGWSRLRSIRLESLDLFCVGGEFEDDLIPMEDADPSERWFFFGIGTAFAPASPSVDITFDFVGSLFETDTIVDLVARRESLLFEPVVKSVTLFVDPSVHSTLRQSLLDEYEGELPSTLTIHEE